MKITAEYTTIKRRIIDTPERVEEVTVPAKFKTVTRTVLSLH